MHFYIFALIFVSLASTLSHSLDISETERTLAEIYELSIQLAKETSPEKIHKRLFAISSSNHLLHRKSIDSKDTVLMVTLTPFFSHYKQNTPITLQRYIWVTASPELHMFCNQYVAQQNKIDEPALITRLQQKLGLPFKAGEHKIVELWVQPEDLFRPCADSEITDNECQLDFPEHAPEEHRRWLAEKVASSFHPHEAVRYSFTSLGYTYDWCPDAVTSVGLSEYVIKMGSEVFVGNIHSPMEYCSQPSPHMSCKDTSVDICVQKNEPP